MMFLWRHVLMNTTLIQLVTPKANVGCKEKPKCPISKCLEITNLEIFCQDDVTGVSRDQKHWHFFRILFLDQFGSHIYEKLSFVYFRVIFACLSLWGELTPLPPTPSEKRLSSCKELMVSVIWHFYDMKKYLLKTALCSF